MQQIKCFLRNFHCTQIFISPINSSLTVTDSHFRGPTRFQEPSNTYLSLLPAFRYKMVWTRTRAQKYLFQDGRLKSLCMHLPAIFFLFNSQPSISSYLNYLRKGDLTIVKGKILMILKDYTKVDLIQSTGLHTKGNCTVNGKTIFKFGG